MRVRTSIRELGIYPSIFITKTSFKANFLKSGSDPLAQARSQWQWRGKVRPAFAVEPNDEQVSVWDFPRPPELVPDTREIIIFWEDIEIARTRRAWAVRETSHPPSFYLPLKDVLQLYLKPAFGSSFCEWKGPAKYWHLVDNLRTLKSVAWSYPNPFAQAQPIADCIAFYARDLVCTVGGEKVIPQPGAFYGGWITPDLAGPFKGEPGSEGW